MDHASRSLDAPVGSMKTHILANKPCTVLIVFFGLHLLRLLPWGLSDQHVQVQCPTLGTQSINTYRRSVLSWCGTSTCMQVLSLAPLACCRTRGLQARVQCSSPLSCIRIHLACRLNQSCRLLHQTPHPPHPHNIIPQTCCHDIGNQGIGGIWLHP